MEIVVNVSRETLVVIIDSAADPVAAGKVWGKWIWNYNYFLKKGLQGPP